MANFGKPELRMLLLPVADNPTTRIHNNITMTFLETVTSVVRASGKSRGAILYRKRHKTETYSLVRHFSHSNLFLTTDSSTKDERKSFTIQHHQQHHPFLGSVSTSTTPFLYSQNSVYPLIGNNLNKTTTTTSTTTTRSISTVSELVPEFAQHWTVWGGSGWLLRNLHWGGVVPMWACMSITNVIVRSALFPLVIESAHTSARFAKVAPEVQFLVSIFQNDIKRQRAEGVSITEQRMLIGKTVQTLRGIYKLHGIHPLAIFKAPLMQIPIFWYFSIDIRKIINGGDPELAQQLTESGFLWIADLTEPDPWYGLPIAAGALLYLNVELAIGKKSLSGETTSKSNVALMLKDFFQSISMFMPCFMSASPAGVQIYLTTSFIFTLFQGAALRNDSFRSMVGLPTLSAPKHDPKYGSEFIKLKELEQKAKEERGDGPLLGKNVLAPGWEGSFAGKRRKSTIEISGEKVWHDSDTITTHIAMESQINPTVQVTPTDAPKVFAPSHQQPEPDLFNNKNGRNEDNPERTTTTTKSQEPPQVNFMEQAPDEAMEAANRGEMPPLIVNETPEQRKKNTNTFNAKKIAQKRKKGSKGGRKHKK